MDHFAGKVAIITGAASGIGRCLCEELSRRGAVITAADINAVELDEVVGCLARQGHEIRAAVLDVTDFEAVKRLVEETAAERGRLDFIFNNAGIVVFGETQDFSLDDWRRVIDVNLGGVVNGVAAAYPLMVRQGCGHIVNTASAAGLVPATGEISYTASKYGVVGLSNVLRIEGRKYGVRVSVVCPGFIKTPIYRHVKLVKLDEDKWMKRGPVGMDTGKCVEEILRGVERDKAIIVVAAGAKLIWFMQRLSPGLVRAFFGLFLAGIRREKVE